MRPVTLSNTARRALYGATAAALPVAVWLAACGPALAQPKPPAAAHFSATKAAAKPPADPECLTVSQQSSSTYTISNTSCAEQSVLSAIELAGSGNLARCFVKKIRTQISIASEGAAPVINYQCIEGAAGCSFEVVRDMFPECHAG